MVSEPARLSRPLLVVCLLVIAVQAVLLGVLIRSDGTGRPHHVPVTIVAPGIVAANLADSVNDSPGQAFDASPGDSAQAARADVRDGKVVAAVLVDLSQTTDVVLVNPDRGDRLNDAVLDRIRAVEKSYDRSIDVRRVQHAGVGDSSAGRATQDGIYLFTFVTCLLGFLLVIAVSLRFGPVPTTFRHGARRLIVYATAAVAVGGLSLLLPLVRSSEQPLLLAALAALSVLIAAVLTQALEALAGLAGTTIAAAGFFVLATPLLTRTDPYLLPEPWPRLAQWTHTGAVFEAARAFAFFGSGAALRPILVLLGWLLVSTVLLVGSARLRQRFGAHPGRGKVGRHWRWRVAGFVVPLAALTVVAIMVVPTAQTRVAALPSRASDSRCVSTGTVTSVADLNRIARTTGTASVFRGADIGADVRLQDGRDLWLFGDTLTADKQFVRNSMLIFGPRCVQAVVPDDGGPIIPNRSTSVGYWPMSVNREARPGYDLVVVATQRVRATAGGDAFSFESLGPSVAIYVVPRGGTPQLVAQHDLGPDSTSKKRPMWGAASAVKDGWVYIYGTANPEQKYVFGFSLRVARVRPDDVLDAAKWRFWDGRAWVRGAGRATELIPADGGVSQTLSVFEQDGTWYAVSKRNEFLGNAITVWQARSPNGPFDAGTKVADLPSDAATGALRYMPLAHPDLLPEPGTVVVSFSRNNKTVKKVIDDPQLYRPRFLRITLPPPTR